MRKYVYFYFTILKHIIIASSYWHKYIHVVNTEVIFVYRLTLLYKLIIVIIPRNNKQQYVQTAT